MLRCDYECGRIDENCNINKNKQTKIPQNLFQSNTLPWSKWYVSRPMEWVPGVTKEMFSKGKPEQIRQNSKFWINKF